MGCRSRAGRAPPRHRRLSHPPLLRQLLLCRRALAPRKALALLLRLARLFHRCLLSPPPWLHQLLLRRRLPQATREAGALLRRVHLHRRIRSQSKTRDHAHTSMPSDPRATRRATHRVPLLTRRLPLLAGVHLRRPESRGLEWRHLSPTLLGRWRSTLRVTLSLRTWPPADLANSGKTVGAGLRGRPSTTSRQTRRRLGSHAKAALLSAWFARRTTGQAEGTHTQQAQAAS